jgi:YVTN family beta-propeller protein
MVVIVCLLLALLSACADSRGKKAYIEGVENDRYNQTVKQSYQAGNLVTITDQNGTTRSVALKDTNGDGSADGIDLDADGNLDIRILAGNELRISPYTFMVPVDINNDGGADYYLYFSIKNNIVQIKLLAFGNDGAPALIFLINGSNQITGLDTNGDSISDDARLNGKVVVPAGSPPDTTPPSQPGTPGGVPGGTSQIDLSWTAATDDTSAASAISYEICQSLAAGGCSTFTATYTVPAGQTSYSATGLSALTTYYYVIRARDASGNYGAVTGEFSATTAAAGTVNNPTYAPVAGVYGVAQNVTISTTTPGATICYTIDGVTTPACDAAALCSVGATYFSAVNVTTTTNMQALACKSGYTASAVVSGTFTIDTVGPTTPGSFAAVPASATQIDLSWTAATDAVTAQANIVYEICQTTTSGACSPFVVSYTTGAGAVSYSATGLNPLTTYYYTIRAKDEVNNTGAATGEISATTNAAGTVADPTYSPTAGTYATPQNVAMSSATPGATICYTTDGVTNPVCDAAATCTTGSTYVSAINTTATTHYRAMACKVGYTASSVVAGTFVIDTTPPTPGNSGILTTSGITTSAITVNWTAATDDVDAPAALEYLLYYSTANNLGSVVAIEANGTPVGTYAANITTQTATGLTSGTTYYFAVIVRDVMGNKAAYGVVSGVTSSISSFVAYVANFADNDVSMYRIDASTGALSTVGTIAAGTNPLFVTVDPSGRFAYVVNTSSSDVSMYGINPGTGTLSANGTIAAGMQPVSATVDPSGRFAYIANNNSNNVSMYTINASTGVLTANGTIPAGTNPSSIAVDHSGRFAYVTNSSSNNVSMYTINASTGVLTANGTIAAGSTPSSVAVDPSGRFAYVANYYGNNLSMYTINASTGVLSANGTIAAGTSPRSVIVHPSGRFAYVANQISGDVSMYTINASTGALTANGTIAAGSSPLSVTVDPSGRFAYVANQGSNMSMYTINTSTGALTANGTIAAGGSPFSVVAARSAVPRFAYVANDGSNDVSMYTINATTGTLSSIGTIAAGTNPYSVVVDPSGRFAYVANAGSNNVSMYTINAATGALSASGTVATGTNPNFLKIHPSGRFAYITNLNSFSVSMYQINAASGTLTPNGSAATGSNPRSISVDPTGQFAYVADVTVTRYTIDTVTGVLTGGSGTGTTGVMAYSAVVHPNNTYLYVTNGGLFMAPFYIDAYAINPATGYPSGIGAIVAGANPYAMTVHPSGRFAYVANAGSNDVSMYNIDAATGALTTSGTIAAGTQPQSVTVDPSGRFVYVANHGSDNVSMYTINASTGSLTAIGTIAAGSGPRSVAVW